LGTPRVPGTLFRVNGEETGVLPRLVANVVEDVELSLWSKVCGVCDAGGSEVLLCFLRHLTRVTRIDLTIAGVVDVEEHDQRRLGAERVEVGGRDIRNQLHVGLVDVRETSDGRTIEELTDAEELLVNRRRWNVEVLLHPREVGEAD